MNHLELRFPCTSGLFGFLDGREGRGGGYCSWSIVSGEKSKYYRTSKSIWNKDVHALLCFPRVSNKRNSLSFFLGNPT